MTAAVPKVSVCIPTYKGGKTIAPAIASVLAQTCTDFELIIIDDGSPDDTASVVAGFQDARLRYLRNAANLGPEGNWNRCLAEARGSYFKLLPHDDLLRPDCLAQQVAVLDADVQQTIALVFSARDVLTPDGRKVARRGFPGAVEGRLPAADVRRQCVRRGTNLLGEPGAVLFRRALVDKVGVFDASEPYVIDMDYWFRLLAHGDAYYCADPLAAFRVSGSQWSVVLGQQQSADFVHCVARHDVGGALGLGTLDRLLGRVTPRLNNLARRVFYRVYLR
jgi:glycosyltransferase involved in cell wall biosynthesis